MPLTNYRKYYQSDLPERVPSFITVFGVETNGILYLLTYSLSPYYRQRFLPTLASLSPFYSLPFIFLSVVPCLHPGKATSIKKGHILCHTLVHVTLWCYKFCPNFILVYNMPNFNLRRQAQNVKPNQSKVGCTTQ